MRPDERSIVGAGSAACMYCCTGVAGTPLDSLRKIEEGEVEPAVHLVEDDGSCALAVLAVVASRGAVVLLPCGFPGLLDRAIGRPCIVPDLDRTSKGKSKRRGEKNSPPTDASASCVDIVAFFVDEVVSVSVAGDERGAGAVGAGGVALGVISPGPTSSPGVAESELLAFSRSAHKSLYHGSILVRKAYTHSEGVRYLPSAEAALRHRLRAAIYDPMRSDATSTRSYWPVSQIS